MGRGSGTTRRTASCAAASCAVSQWSQQGLVVFVSAVTSLPRTSFPSVLRKTDGATPCGFDPALGTSQRVLNR